MKMGWFLEWWEGLGLFGQTLACAAIPATAVMLVQTVLLLAGGAFSHSDGGADAGPDLDHGSGGDGGLDFDHDHSFDHGAEHEQGDLSEASSGLRLFTLRGIVAFFAVGGWVGLATFDGTRSEGLSLLLAMLSGGAALIFAALVIKWALMLQDSGNINPKNAIAKMATVYIPVPPLRSSTGRVTLLLQERFVEMDAVTDSPLPLKTGQSVQVVGVTGGNVLIIRPV
ncbi:MAG: hypothetical protein LBU47_00075 [Christensenellaceae bacterium]|jgi:hypothetical protein|nr:hypothetical protein [Christensenellaceae bacterium]